jgi:hypothetical protein
MTETRTAKQLAAKLRDDIAFYASGGVPSADELAAAPEISEWYIAIVDASRPPRRVMVVRGNFHGHPKIPAGAAGATSPVVWMDRNRIFVRTLNRLYRLGSPIEFPGDGADL